MVEWSITAVLKTAVLRGTGGSNPSLSAHNNKKPAEFSAGFFVFIWIGTPKLFVVFNRKTTEDFLLYLPLQE